MLYRTHIHHPLFFPSNSNPSSLSTQLTLPSLSTAATTTNTCSQVERYMEGTLKGGLFGPKQAQQQQVIMDDFVNLNNQNAVSVSVAGEDFFVDQLLNFNLEEEEKNDDGGLVVVLKEDPFQVKEKENEAPNKVSPFLSPPLETDRNRDDFGSVLSIPAEEEDLEWLSHFVEESFSEFSTPYPTTGLGPEKLNPKPKPEPGSGLSKAPRFTPLPNKSRRSKRARTGAWVWSTALAESSSSPTSSTTSSGLSSPNPDPVSSRKQRKREGGPGAGPPRSCSHCGAQKTPQWRTGPNGAKTLCNACGVRFKSGRLLPEYRPACSPTFSSELHSNSHRKVLEMRKKKQSTVTVTVTGRPEPGLGHPVPSFG